MNEDPPIDPPSDEQFEREAKMVQQRLNYFESLKEVAMTKGYVILEGWTCQKCKGANLFSHAGAEVVPCMSCGHKHATIAPRPPADDEIAAIHYIMAVKMLRDVYGERAKELPPLTAGEIAQLSTDIRLLLARHRTEIVVETALKLDKLAEEFAGINGEA